MGKLYIYSFNAWPEEVSTFTWSKEIFHLFGLLNTRVEKEFTETEFNDFRKQLGNQGLTLREIERVPWHEPENIP